MGSPCPEGKSRLVAMLVPSRSFVSPLVALGATLAKPPDVSNETNLWKANLEPGTRCVHCLNGKYIQCIVLGNTNDEKKLLVLETSQSIPGLQKGQLIRVPESKLGRLALVDPDQSQGARIQIKGRDVVEQIYDEETSFAYFGQKKVDVLICGVVDEIVEETKFIEVSCRNKTTSVFQLLRPRSHFGAKLGYRSDIIPALQKPRPYHESIGFVIFDGAYAFVQWRRHFKNIPCLVILDDSSPSRGRLQSSIDLVQRRLANGQYLKGNLPDVPRQVEVMAVEY